MVRSHNLKPLGLVASAMLLLGGQMRPVGATAERVGRAEPAISAVSDISGISPRGFDDFSGVPSGPPPARFPWGTLSGGYVGLVGTDWAKWNPQKQGQHVVIVLAGSETITFAHPAYGVVVKAEPNDSGWHRLYMEALDASGDALAEFSWSVKGQVGERGGAAYIGIVSTIADIAQVSVFADSASQGFAFSDLTYRKGAPAPTLTATLYSWTDSGAVRTPAAGTLVSRSSSPTSVTSRALLKSSAFRPLTFCTSATPPPGIRIANGSNATGGLTRRATWPARQGVRCRPWTQTRNTQARTRGTCPSARRPPP